MNVHGPLMEEDKGVHIKALPSADEDAAAASAPTTAI